MKSCIAGILLVAEIIACTLMACPDSVNLVEGARDVGPLSHISRIPPVSDKLVEGSLTFGMVDRGRVYACIMDRQNKNKINLLIGDRKNSRPSEKYVLPLSIRWVNTQLFLRWRIAHGYCWGILADEPMPCEVFWQIRRIPMTDMPRFHADNDLLKSISGKTGKERSDAIKEYSSYMGSLVFTGIRPMWLANLVSDAKPGTKYYDFLPTSKNSCRLFMLWRSELTIWDYNADKVGEVWPPKGAKPYVLDWDKLENVGDWWKIQTVETTLDEPFYGFLHGGTYFFVTDSGRLYTTKKQEKGRTRLEEIRLPNNQQVVGILSEVQGDKTFAFTKDCYFELSLKPQLKKLDVPNSGGMHTIEAVLDHARAAYKE